MSDDLRALFQAKPGVGELFFLSPASLEEVEAALRTIPDIEVRKGDSEWWGVYVGARLSDDISIKIALRGPPKRGFAMELVYDDVPEQIAAIESFVLDRLFPLLKATHVQRRPHDLE